GIDKADCHPKNEIRFSERLLYDNSSPHPPEEFIFENSNAEIESFSPSPIPIEVKENQEKDKIGSKLDKKGKRGKAKKSLKQLQLKEEEKPKKTKKEWPKRHTRIKSYSTALTPP
nr:hypothetical protein [Tanacetum cinerariifolium]